ncbi:MAG: glycosyltransferase family 2 protein [Candidatus Omnitrophota bacterium]
MILVQGIYVKIILMNETGNQAAPPLVSVIIPTLNREKYIRQCIESVLSQDYPDLEVIVVDNGSTDNTEEILKSFGGRIKFLKEEKRGVSAARNKGIRESRGEFIALLDSDDYCLPGKISLSVQKLLEDPCISLIYTDYILVDSEGNQTEIVKKFHPAPEQFLRFFLLNFGILPSTTLLRKEYLEKIGYFDETMLEGAEDTDMLFKALKAGCRFGHIPRPLNAYRWHSENISRPNRPGEKPNNLYCDRILSSAIKNFTVPELFEDILGHKNWKKRVKKEYDGLTDILYFRHFPLSAAAAAKKSREIGRPFFLSFFLTNALQAFCLLYSVLETAAKMAAAAVSPKTTRQTAGRYRRKICSLFFKLRYRLFRIFFYRYGKLACETTR